MTEKPVPLSKGLLGVHVALMVTGIICMIFQFVMVLLEPDASFAHAYHGTWGGGLAILTGFMYPMFGKERHVCRCGWSIALCVLTILGAIGMAVMAGLGVAADVPQFDILKGQVISNVFLIVCAAVMTFLSIATAVLSAKSMSMIRLTKLREKAYGTQ